MENLERSRFLRRAVVVTLYAVAMAYLESAVVVYLQHALSITPQTLFPLRNEATLDGLGTIEIGREVATLVMLVTVGWLAGRTAWERLAWTAVAFGIWDISYYAWLWVFISWPTSPTSYDLLFLLPVPWVAPVWAPTIVSAALVSVGLMMAQRVQDGEQLCVTRWQLMAFVTGGLIVIFSFTLDAGRILAGGLPSHFAWPIFTAGMALALFSVTSLLNRK